MHKYCNTAEEEHEQETDCESSNEVECRESEGSDDLRASQTLETENEGEIELDERRQEDRGMGKTHRLRWSVMM